MEYPYPKSPHERVAESLFGDLAEPSAQRETVSCVIIGFVNRSGSNYLAELLKSTGRFAGLAECLNAPTMSFLAPRYGAKTLSDYLLRHYKEDLKQQNQMWGLKAGWAQTAMMLRAGVIGNILKPTFINVRRRDIAAQAISYFIAERSNQWTSKEKQTTARGDITYDGAAILGHYRGIVDSYSKLEQITFLSGCPTHCVVYEELLDSPNSEITKLTGAILGRELTPMLSAVEISVQRDELDQTFKSRFLSELAELQWKAQ
jgi:LPS sulfotransferase NodH